MSRDSLSWSILLALPVLYAAACGGEALEEVPSRHLIYLHGRIVQVEQSARPVHPEFGAYELEKILGAFRERGFEVSGGIRPREQSVSAAADVAVAEVRALLDSGVPAERITLVGASMGGGIALLAAARLGEPELRVAVLGVCLSSALPQLVDAQGRSARGRLFAVREASDETTADCAPWTAELAPGPGLAAREIVVDTGLRHGFFYRPLPEWLEPLVAWAEAATAPVDSAPERPAAEVLAPPVDAVRLCGGHVSGAPAADGTPGPHIVWEASWSRRSRAELVGDYTVSHGTAAHTREEDCDEWRIPPERPNRVLEICDTSASGAWSECPPPPPEAASIVLLSTMVTAE